MAERKGSGGEGRPDWSRDRRLVASEADLANPRLRKSSPNRRVLLRLSDTRAAKQAVRAEIGKRRNALLQTGAADPTAKVRLDAHEQRLIELIDKLKDPQLPLTQERADLLSKALGNPLELAGLSEEQVAGVMKRLTDDLYSSIRSHNDDPATKKRIMIAPEKGDRSSGKLTWESIAATIAAPQPVVAAPAPIVTEVPKPRRAPTPAKDADINDIVGQAFFGGEKQTVEPVPVAKASTPVRRKRSTKAEPVVPPAPLTNVARERARRIANGELTPVKATRAPAKKREKTDVSYNAGETLSGEKLAAAIREAKNGSSIEPSSFIRDEGLTGGALAEVANKRPVLTVAPEKGTPEYQALENAREVLAKANEAETKEHTWNKRFLSFGGFFGGKTRRKVEADRNQAEAQWKRALESYAKAQRTEERAKAISWATERWGAGSAKATKFIETHNGSVMRRRVLGEMRELNARRIELMAAREKTLMQKTLQWYGKQPALVRYGGPALLSAALATGLTITTGGVGTLAAASVYGAGRFVSGIAGTGAGALAGAGAARAARWWLKIEEKAADRSVRARKTNADIRDAMRSSTMSTDDAVALYGRTLAQNNKEIRREQLIQIAAGVGVGALAGAGTAITTGLALAGTVPQVSVLPAEQGPKLGRGIAPPVEPPSPHALPPESMPPSSEPQAALAGPITYTPPVEEGARLPLPLEPRVQTPFDDVNRAPQTADISSLPTEAAPTIQQTEPVPVPPPADVYPTTEVAPAPEVALDRKNYFSEKLSVEKGDTVWALSARKLASDNRFFALDRAQQDFVLDTMRRDIAALPAEKLRAMGFRGTDINNIYAGDSLDLSHLDRADLRESAYEKALELSRAQKENILRYRGWNATQIAAELNRPSVAVPSTPPTPTGPAALPRVDMTPPAPTPTPQIEPAPRPSLPPLGPTPLETEPVPQPAPVAPVQNESELTPTSTEYAGDSLEMTKLSGNDNLYSNMPDSPKAILGERLYSTNLTPLENAKREYLWDLTNGLVHGDIAPTGYAQPSTIMDRGFFYDALRSVSIRDIQEIPTEQLVERYETKAAPMTPSQRQDIAALYNNLKEQMNEWGLPERVNGSRAYDYLEAVAVEELERRSNSPRVIDDINRAAQYGSEYVAPAFAPPDSFDVAALGEPPQTSPSLPPDDLEDFERTPQLDIPSPVEAPPLTSDEVLRVQPIQTEPALPQEPASIPVSPEARSYADAIAQGMDDSVAKERAVSAIYAEDLRSMFDVEGSWLSQGEDGLLRFEAKLGWKDAATFLRDASENLEATADALDLSPSEVATFRQFMERARSDYGVPIEGNLKSFMRAAAEAQANVLR